MIRIKLKTKLMLSASMILIVSMSLSIFVVSVVLNRQNREKAEVILNESTLLISDAIHKKRNILLSTSRQVAETKSIFGIMIFLVTNKPHFDILLMKQMYRYLSEAVSNICRTAEIDETIIYDMDGRPISFVNIKHGIVELGYIHSLSKLIGETAMLVDDMDLTDSLWRPIEFQPARTLETHTIIPDAEEITIEVIDDVLSLVTLIPIEGEIFDFGKKTMVTEQLGFLKSIQKIDQQFFSEIKDITGVEIRLIISSSGIDDMIEEYDLSNVDKYAYNPKVHNQNHLFRVNDRKSTSEDYYMGVFPIFSREQPIVLIECALSKKAETERIKETTRLMGMVFFLCIVIVLPISMYFAKSITEPISNVVKGLRSITAGKIHRLDFDPKSKDEVSELIDGFNMFSEKIVAAQSQLRKLSNNIVKNQEMERAAIARELHDELGQVLNALRMNAIWIADHLKNNDPKVAEQALNMGQLIDHSIDEVRHIALRLRPRILDDLGLFAAIEWFATDFEKRTGISCDFQGTNLDKIGNNIAITVYRIIQEALTNVSRHSQADYSQVKVNCFNDKIFLEITDNGKGYNNKNRPEPRGLGIPGIRERIILLNGTLEIETESGTGTTIYCSIPLIEKSNEIVEYDRNITC